MGPGWLGVHGLGHWYCMQTDRVRSVALVGPTLLTEASYTRSIQAPKRLS